MRAESIRGPAAPGDGTRPARLPSQRPARHNCRHPRPTVPPRRIVAGSLVAGVRRADAGRTTHHWGQTICASSPSKSKLAKIDIASGRGYGFSRSQEHEGSGRHELPGSRWCAVSRQRRLRAHAPRSSALGSSARPRKRAAGRSAGQGARSSRGHRRHHRFDRNRPQREERRKQAPSGSPGWEVRSPGTARPRNGRWSPVTAIAIPALPPFSRANRGNRRSAQH